MQPYKFILDDKVRSKGILSPIVTGKVFAIMNPEWYIATLPRDIAVLVIETYDKAFPGWQYKPMLGVVKDIRVQNSFHEGAIATQMIVYPMDELELHDWVEELNKTINIKGSDHNV